MGESLFPPLLTSCGFLVYRAGVWQGHHISFKGLLLLLPLGKNGYSLEPSSKTPCKNAVIVQGHQALLDQTVGTE